MIEMLLLAFRLSLDPSWRPWRLGGSLFRFQIVVQIKLLDPVDGALAVEAFDHASPRDAADLFAQGFVPQQPRQGDESTNARCRGRRASL